MDIQLFVPKGYFEISAGIFLCKDTRKHRIDSPDTAELALFQNSAHANGKRLHLRHDVL